MKKTFTYFAISVLMLVVSNMNSQGIQWLKTYDRVSTDIAPSPNSDLIVSSQTSSGTSNYDSYNLTCTGYYNSSISKINPAGNVSLIKNFTDSFVVISKIAVDRFSNIFCFGTYTGTVVFDTYTLTGLSDPSQTGFVIKMNSSGSVQWAQSIKRYILYPEMTTDQLGNLYLSGWYGDSLVIGTNTVVSVPGSGYDSFVAKFDPNGVCQWIRSIGGNGGDLIYGITVDNQNNVYAAGSFSNTCAFGQTSLSATGNFDAFICKLNTYGNFLWAKQFGSPNFNVFRGITATGGDKLYVIGDNGGPMTIGSSTLSGGPGGLADYIAKFDTSGTAIWAKEFSGVSTIRSVTSDGSDVVYTAGFFAGSVCFGSTTNTAACLSAPNNRHGFISKLDGSGNYLWVKQIKTGIDISFGFKLATEQWGKLFVSGTVSSSTVTSLSVETFSTTGDNRTSYFMRINPSVIGLDEYSINDERLVYPNPVHNNGTITIGDNETFNSANASISNLLGQTVFETKVQTNEIHLKNSNIVPGVYFLKVSSGSKIVLNKKIVIE